MTEATHPAPLANSHFDKRVSNDLPLLLWVGGHVQSLANAFPWRPVLLRDGEGCSSIVECVSRVHHYIFLHQEEDSSLATK